MLRTAALALLLTGLAAAAVSPPAPASPRPEPVYGPGPVYVISIDDEAPGGAISDWNVTYLKKSLEQARGEGAALFIIEITTNGGSGDIMQEISAVLLRVEGLRTATFVRSHAFSAGALVAMSCDDIYMEKGSVIGASSPVVMSAEGVEKMPEKYERKVTEAFTRFFRAKVKEKGHSAAMAGAMVDQDAELLEVTFADGRSALMTREEYDEVAAGLPFDKTPKTKVRSKPLTLEYDEAVKWGLARAAVKDREEILKGAGLSGRKVIDLVPTLSDRMGRFFSSGVVVAILVALSMMALYIELNHPSGVAAGFFLLVLGLFFWANFMAGTANVVSIVLVLAGAALLAVEVFFFPGFGVAGISGAVLVLVGLVAARIPAGVFSPSPEGTGGAGLPSGGEMAAAIGSAAGPVVVGLGMGALGIALLMRFFPNLPLLSRLVLTADLSGAVVTAAGPAGLERPEQLIGRTGTAHTNLRPGGTARFDGRLLDVISDGEWLEAGTPVRIVSADSNRIVVRRA